MDILDKLSKYLFGTSIPDTTDAAAFFAAYMIDKEAAITSEHTPSWFKPGNWLDRNILEPLANLVSGANDLLAGWFNKDGIAEAEAVFKAVEDSLNNNYYVDSTTGATQQIPESIQQVAVDGMKSTLQRSYGLGSRYSRPNFAEIGHNAHKLLKLELEENLFRQILADAGLGKMKDVSYSELKTHYASDPRIKALFDFVETMTANSAGKLEVAVDSGDPSKIPALLDFSDAEAAALATEYGIAVEALTGFKQEFTELKKHIDAAKNNKVLKNLGLSDEAIIRIAIKTLDAENAGIKGDSDTHLTSAELTKLEPYADQLSKEFANKGDVLQRVRERLSNAEDIDFSSVSDGGILVKFEGNGQSPESVGLQRR